MIRLIHLAWGEILKRAIETQTLKEGKLLIVLTAEAILRMIAVKDSTNKNLLRVYPKRYSKDIA